MFLTIKKERNRSTLLFREAIVEQGRWDPPRTDQGCGRGRPLKKQGDRLVDTWFGL